MKSIGYFTMFVTILISAILAIGAVYHFQTADMAFAQTQPNLNATSVYNSGQMVLGSNVKHLVIAIPNEGHHGPGEEDEARFMPFHDRKR